MNSQLLFFTIALMVAPVVFGNSLNHPTILAAPLSMHHNSSVVNGTLCHNASDASPVIVVRRDIDPYVPPITVPTIALPTTAVPTTTTQAPSTTSVPSRKRRSLEDAVKSIFPGAIHITTTEAPLPNSTHNDSLVVIKRDVDCEHPGHQHGNAPHHTGSGPRPGMMHPLPHRQGHPNMPINSTMVPHGHVKVTTVQSVPASNVTAAPLSTTSDPLTTDGPAPATDTPSTTAAPSTTGSPVIVVRRSLNSHMEHLNFTTSSEPCHNETTTPLIS
jgi:hypothetical protein